MIKENDILSYLKERDLLDYSGENKIVCGIVMPSTLDYVLFGAASVLSTKYNILSYSNKGLVIMPIDNITGKIRKDEHAFIPRDQILKVEMKPKITHFKLLIETPNGVTGFKINKVLFGANWHKKNLPNLVSEINGSEIHKN
ncbi:hypothetical protein [Bacillus sp. FJAT-47783]|uniref:hypothetical protein n=1 Tax=Bacillus sp. FJAT-47783 TaxID=2922712 RepID=UPI001FACB364|nr:hypothetical protein [Bacillus sp. FJAT-47783]